MIRTGFVIACVLALATATLGCSDDQNCTLHADTFCKEAITYYMDSCGSQGEVAEMCDCGCNGDYTGCETCQCEPDCADRDCGGDGCGGSCGTCPGNDTCNAQGQCEGCTADCAGIECGDDGCGGSCGTCPGNDTCNAQGQCEGCTANCAGIECGDDSCGGSCGTCPGNDTCNAQGQCEGCTADCAGIECGDDGCGGSCGTCPGGETCDGQGQCQSSSNLLLVDCSVPFVLDANQVGDMMYMTSHFADLVQQWGITGTVDGVDVAAYPEKMYYGTNDGNNTLSLTQVSMSAGLSPTYTVKIDFIPDSDVTTGAAWTVGVGINPMEASVGLVEHVGAQSMCLYAMGTAGQLNFGTAINCDQIEGGSFDVSGTALMTNPWDVLDTCSNMPPNLPCCAR